MRTQTGANQTLTGNLRAAAEWTRALTRVVHGRDGLLLARRWPSHEATLEKGAPDEFGQRFASATDDP